ncbi:hypothetical protein Cadr_000006114 [Camelus dromedarius]|uniref:Uncharacterized protein n=1 Tax=Camelus dromedarius TaxID=9838 RepID=A0A5N4E484_CAMDR|nr:hypothetical protein Cadr_000006114 [Camelus dromedarius]
MWVLDLGRGAEGGKRDPGKVSPSEAWGPLGDGGSGGTREMDFFLSSKTLQPVLERKRRGGQRALRSGKRNADTFRSPGASRSPTSRGRRGGPHGWQRGCPAREGQRDAEQSFFRLTNTRVVSGGCPAKAPRERRGAARVVGKGQKGGGGNGIPPSLGQAVVEEARGPAENRVLETAEPGSRRPHQQQGAPQSPPHRLLCPQGPGTSAAKALRPDIPQDRPQLPGGPAGTPQPPAVLFGCKTCPHPSPSSAFPPPQATEKGNHRREAWGKSGTVAAAVLDLDSDTDLMIVVSEDHSLGRHVSQRSHRTDRSREKPEPGARRPGARSPRRARGERGKGGWGVAAERSAACVRERPGPECASPREGADPGRRQRGAGWGRGGRSGIARGGVQARPKRPPAALRSVRPRTTRWQETEGKGENTLRRGGATQRVVELVESEGRSKSSAAEYWEREGAGPARAGLGNAPGRVSSAGLAGRTRSGLYRAPDISNPLPSPAPRRLSAVLAGFLGRGAALRRGQGKAPGNLEKRGYCDSLRWAKEEEPCPAHLPACFLSRLAGGFPSSKPAKLRSLRQSTLSEDSRLLFLPVFRGFVV